MHIYSLFIKLSSFCYEYLQIKTSYLICKSTNLNDFKAMATLYRMVLAATWKPYRIGLLLSHENGDFGAVLWRDEAAPRRSWKRKNKQEREPWERGWLHIGQVSVPSLVQCKQVFILYWIDFHVSMKNSLLQCRHGQEIFYQCHILTVKMNTLTLE